MTHPPEERARVLVVDDEKFIRDILADFLGMEGYVVRTAEDGASALDELDRAHYDLVISDLKMPSMGGIELLEAIGKAAPNALTVIMTGFGTVETAIDAMKRGAYDYILKPFKVEEVIHVVQRGLEKQRLAAENLRLKEALSPLQGERGHRREPLARRGARDRRPTRALHEIHGDLVSHLARRRRGRLLRAPAPRCSPERSTSERRASARSTRARSSTHFAADPTLVEQGTQGRALLRGARRTCRSQSLVAVPLRMKQRLLGWIAVGSLHRGQALRRRAAQAASASSPRAPRRRSRTRASTKISTRRSSRRSRASPRPSTRWTATPSGHSERVAIVRHATSRTRLGLSPSRSRSSARAR